MSGADRECGCDMDTMIGLSPMHPAQYLELACDEHRAEFIAANPCLAKYAPLERRQRFLGLGHG